MKKTTREKKLHLTTKVLATMILYMATIVPLSTITTVTVATGNQNQQSKTTRAPTSTPTVKKSGTTQRETVFGSLLLLLLMWMVMGNWK
nr:hypothetical protein [Candidatus Njordarchaeota archaeon]